MNRFVIAILAAILLLAGMVAVVVALGVSYRSETSVGKSFPSKSAELVNTRASKDSGWLTEYTLTERSGRSFRSRDLKGKVHVVNFFFATCPTVCRIQTGAVQSLQKEFGPRGVVFLSITCDPDHDTPVALAQYAKEFHADPQQWLFLTGDLTYLRRVGAEMYYLPVDKQTHSESLLVLDGQGKIRGRFSWKDAKELAAMKQLLHELLSES